jgi:hypothetical protein
MLDNYPKTFGLKVKTSRTLPFYSGCVLGFEVAIPESMGGLGFEVR